MRVFLLKHNKTSAVTTREGQIKDLIKLVYEVIYQQRQLQLSSHTYRKRSYTLRSSHHEYIIVPCTIRTESDLNKVLFEPIFTLFSTRQKQREELDRSSVFRPPIRGESVSGDLTELLVQIGSKVKVRWSSDELQGSGWRAGWYEATVHNYCRESDIITITYIDEPGVPYDEELTPLVANKKHGLLSEGYIQQVSYLSIL